MADTAHKDLAQLGINDVPCPTASLFLDLSCEEAPKGNGVVPLGCSLPEVKAVMLAMQKGH